MKKYPIARPHIATEEGKSVLEVLRSGILSIGPKTEQFEKKIADKIGVKYACATSSGTAGLHMAVIAAGIKKGDEVITSPFSFVASANCILYAGAKPVFADIEPATFNIDPLKIEAKITPKTKAILVVHIFGQSADMDPIKKIAKEYNLKIIEDACESIGSRYKNKPVGTFGQSAVFAFYPNKQITTGEGGIIATNSKKVYGLCRSLRNQGRAENMQWLDHRRLGYNYRMDELSAALGLVQVGKLDFFLKERNKIAVLYSKYLAGHDDLMDLPKTGPNNTHGWFVYVVKLKKHLGERRNRVILNLTEAGVSTKPYLPSIHLFSFYKKKFGYKKGDFPVSESVSKSSLALPFYIGLKEKDIKTISQKVIEALKK